MSFILDALKKSESERQKGGAPALFEARVAPPRRRLPLWLLVLAVLLVINAAGLAWVLLRDAHGVPSAAGAPGVPDTAGVPGAAGVPGVGPGEGTGGRMSATGAGSTAAALTRNAAPAASTAAAASGAPAASDPAVAYTANRDQDRGGGQASPEAAAAAGADAAAAARAEDDNAPAVEPARDGPARPDAALSADLIRGLPDYQEAASAPGSTLPALKLDLHAYAANPADRFIMLNMTRQQEGDTTAQGVKIEAITAAGVVLSYQGVRYMLQR